MPFVVSNILAPENLPQDILLLSKSGDLLLADANLEPRVHHPSKVSVDPSTLQRYFCFSRSDCSYLSDRASPSDTIIAYLRRTESFRIALFGVAKAGIIEELEDIEIPLGSEVRIAFDIICMIVKVESNLCRILSWTYRLAVLDS